MPRPRVKQRKELRGSDDSARQGGVDPRVTKLQQAFAQFRRTHRPGTRYPDSLRAAVVAALGGGASAAELLRACKLTAEQLAVWQRREDGAMLSGEPVRQQARVFSVVDDACEPAVEEMELRIGGWAIRIRRADG